MRQVNLIPDVSIFNGSWWLDICTDSRWKKELFCHKHGVLSFTYAYRERIAGFKEIYRPPLTPFLGIAWEKRNSVVTESQELTVLAEGIPLFLDKLPSFVRFKMNFHPMFGWWSPFFWGGFSQTTRYTYRITNLDDIDGVWNNFNVNAKRNIKKAEKTIQIYRGNNPELLYSLFNKTMRHQGKRPGYRKKLLIDLCNEIYARRSGEILIAYDKQGVPHSAILVVWGNNESYYLVGGTDPQLRTSGAMMLTMWNAIKDASAHANIFDFEGSMQKGIDKFIRNFGAHPCPYHQIYKNLF